MATTNVAEYLQHCEARSRPVMNGFESINPRGHLKLHMVVIMQCPVLLIGMCRVISGRWELIESRYCLTGLVLALRYQEQQQMCPVVS